MSSTIACELSNLRIFSKLILGISCCLFGAVGPVHADPPQEATPDEVVAVAMWIRYPVYSASGGAPTWLEKEVNAVQQVGGVWLPVASSRYNAGTNCNFLGHRTLELRRPPHTHVYGQNGGYSAAPFGSTTPLQYPQPPYPDTNGDGVPDVPAGAPAPYTLVNVPLNAQHINYYWDKFYSVGVPNVNPQTTRLSEPDASMNCHGYAYGCTVQSADSPTMLIADNADSPITEGSPRIANVDGGGHSIRIYSHWQHNIGGGSPYDPPVAVRSLKVVREKNRGSGIYERTYAEDTRSFPAVKTPKFTFF